MRKNKGSTYPEPTEFFPKNPNKYSGTLPIIVRSSYERAVFKSIDRHPHVKSWASESDIIKYVSPVDGRTHRYYPDVKIEFIGVDGKVIVELIEIKPFCQTQPPVFTENQKDTTKRKMAESWAINRAKWEAAQAVCRSKGWKFRLLTEREIFGRK